MKLATTGQLPALLRNPPWASGQRAPDPPRIALPPLSRAPRFTWSDEEREKARNAERQWELTAADEARLLDGLHIDPAARKALRAGKPLLEAHFTAPPATQHHALADLLRLPDAMAISLWNGVPSSAWYFSHADVANIIGKHGDAAIPGMVAFSRRHPVQGLRVARWLDAEELAVIAMRALRRLKIGRQHAIAWLLAHADTSAQMLLRQLFGEDDDQREEAQSALHEAALQELRPTLVDAAQAHGPTVVQALREQLESDPLLRLPRRMPKVPAFFDPAALHRPRLIANGAALPDDAMRHLGPMLAISKPDQPYAGLDAVRVACTGPSLAAFAWDVFEAWWAAGAPSKDAWAFAALGLLGDDSTAHRLGPRVLRWDREGAKHHACAAVDLLAGYGSDAALMHSSHLADRCKREMVRKRAAAKVDEVAEQRGLSRIELADRLVPTLGLDESRRLDFGPRHFSIAFDETLAPYVRDAQGARLKDLPKPRQDDDAAKAGAATLRWKQLKKDMKTLARVQLARLEQAMVDQRRWPFDEFERFFVAHPLTRELAARLVWAAFDDAGRVIDACRIAEDGTLADARDQRWQPPEGARFGIAHRLTLAPDVVDAFRGVFADYDVLQPFAQLEREIYALTPADAAGSSLDRFEGRDVATGAVINLIDRSWLRGETQEGGTISWIERPVGAGLVAHLELEPGMYVGQLSSQPRQTLGKLSAWSPHDRSAPYEPHKPATFTEADPILLSETLRDVHRLSPQLP